MANLAAQIRAQAQSELPGAAVVERNRGSIKHALGNRRIIDATNTPLHILNTATEIDTAWIASTVQPWLWEQPLNDLRAFAMPGTAAFDAGEIYRVETRDRAFGVSFEPQPLGWYGNHADPSFVDVTTQISNKTAAAGTVNDGLLTWSGAYGAGTGYVIDSQPGRFQKRLTIASIAALPQPSATLLAQPLPPQLALISRFSLTAGIQVFVDGVLWGRTPNSSASGGVVEFRSDQGALLFRFAPAWATDGVEQFDPVYRVRRSGSSLFIEVRVSYTDLQGKTNVVIDPTVDAQIGASAGDSNQEDTGFAARITDIGVLLGSPSGAGVEIYRADRFTGITTDSGATFSGSYFQPYMYSTNGINADLYAEDASSPAALGTSTNDISGRTLTTAKAAWPGTAVSNEAFATSPSIDSVIQELQDTYGAYSSGVMNIINVGTGSSSSWRTYDNNTAEAAKLHLDYTAASTQTARPTSDVSVGSWTTDTGGTTNLYQAIDEVSPSDTDYIRSEVTPSASVVNVGLGTVTDPGVATAHIVRYRYQKNDTNDVLDLTVRLKQTTTTIATWTHTGITTTWTTAAQTLSAGEANSITDYSALRLEFTANAP